MILISSILNKNVVNMTTAIIYDYKTLLRLSVLESEICFGTERQCDT